jgi:hypothetical protein
VTEVSVALRVWPRVDTIMAQGQGLLSTFRQLLEGTIFRRRTLTVVAAGMRRRMDAILPHGKLVVRTIRQLLGNLSRHKGLTFLISAVLGLLSFFSYSRSVLGWSLPKTPAIQRLASSLLRPGAPNNWGLRMRSLSNRPPPFRCNPLTSQASQGLHRP